jgi:hypothetical protein
MADAAAPAAGSDGPGRDDGTAGLQLAQAASGAFGDPIGAIRDVAGQVLVVHPDGTSEPAAVGLPVFANDIVATGPEAAVRIVFLDGTTFSLGANGQIRLDRLIFDPDGSNNGLDATVVKGSFVFITGQIEKTEGEGITINTPAGSIGIRGTSGAGTEDPRTGNWIFTLFRDPDGTLSRFTVFNPAGTRVLDQEFETTEVAGRQLAPSETFILSPAQAGALFNDALRVLQQEFPDLQSPEQRGELENIIPAAGEEDAPVEQAEALPIPQALIDMYGLELALTLADLLEKLGLEATDLVFIELEGSLVPIFLPEAPRSPLIDVDRAPNQIASNAEAGDYVGLTVQPNIPILSGPVVFSLVNDAGGLFAIDPVTGQVTVTGDLPPGSYFIVARATTAAGVSADTAFQITIVPDAVPLPANDILNIADRVGLTVNLAIALDISGSMGANPGVAGFASRLDLARAAIAQLFAAHGATAQLNIQIIAFAGVAAASGWLNSIDEANAFLAGLAPGGATNYAVGINATMAAFADAPPADKAEIYFLSDGAPTAGTGLAAAGLLDEWEDFLSDPANGIAHAYAVGVGTGVQANDPDHVQVAFPNDDLSTLLVVTDPGQLVGTLESTAPNPVSGNVLANDDFGGDGPAAERITQLEHGGDIFTRDSAVDGDVVRSNDGQVIVISTELGTLQFNFDTGDFTYTPSIDVTIPQVDLFLYTIADSDGSTAEARLEITITDAAARVLLAADLLRADDLIDDGADDILAEGAPNLAPAAALALPFFDAPPADPQPVIPVD